MSLYPLSFILFIGCVFSLQPREVTTLLLNRTSVDQWDCVSGAACHLGIQWLQCNLFTDGALRCKSDLMIRTRVSNVTVMFKSSDRSIWRVSYSLDWRSPGSVFGALLCPLLQSTTDVWLGLIRLVSPYTIGNLSLGCGEETEDNGRMNEDPATRSVVQPGPITSFDYCFMCGLVIGATIILTLAVTELLSQHPLQTGRVTIGGVDLKLVLPSHVLLRASNVLREPGKEARLVLTQLISQAHSRLCPDEVVRVGITSTLNKQRQHYTVTMIITGYPMHVDIATALSDIHPELCWRCNAWNNSLVLELQFEADLPAKRQQRRGKKSIQPSQCVDGIHCTTNSIDNTDITEPLQ